MKAMGRPQDEQNANVFQQGGDTVRAASTEGSMAPSGGAQGSAPNDQQAPEVQTPGSRSKLFSKNAGKAQSPVDLKGMQGQIKGAGDSLQKEANSYIANADNTYENGVNGSDKALIQDFAGIKKYDPRTDDPTFGQGPIPTAPGTENVTGLTKPLDWQTAFLQGPGELKGYESSVNTNVANAGLLGTDAGIQEIFRRQGSPEYSAGDGAFDTALLRKNAAFNELRDQTLSQNADLQKKAQTIADPTEKAAQERLNSSYGDWRRDVEGELDGAIGHYDQAAKKSEQEFDRDLGHVAAANDLGAFTQSLAMQKQLAEDNPELAPYLDGNDTGYGEYYTPSSLTADDTSAQDFVSDRDAGYWNKVLTLLGRGGNAVVSGQYAGKKAADVAKGDFDTSGYVSSRLDAASKEKTTTDAKLSADMKKMMSDAAVQNFKATYTPPTPPPPPVPDAPDDKRNPIPPYIEEKSEQTVDGYTEKPVNNPFVGPGGAAPTQEEIGESMDPGNFPVPETAEIPTIPTPIGPMNPSPSNPFGRSLGLADTEYDSPAAPAPTFPRLRRMVRR